MTITFSNSTLADLLSELIELKNFISKLQYQIDGSYTQIDQGDNQISLDRIIQLTSLLNDFDNLSLIQSLEDDISEIFSSILDDIIPSINAVKQVLDTFIDETTLRSEINDLRNKINNIRNNVDDIEENSLNIKNSLDQLVDSDFHLIISDIDEKLETIRDTRKIVSYIPYKFDNAGSCEQKIAYLYDNGDLVDSSFNPITISSIESNIDYCS